MSGDWSRRYPPELREGAVRMVAEVRGQHETEWAAMRAVSELLGIGTTETVRKSVRQAEVDAGTRPGTTTGRLDDDFHWPGRFESHCDTAKFGPCPTGVKWSQVVGDRGAQECLPTAAGSAFPG